MAACVLAPAKLRENRTVLAFALCACLWLCGLLACPQTAYAWLYDVTESYPASQPISISGDVLTAADIPEGNYSSTISSSSSMCKFTNVIVTSVGGELWVTFNLSTAYDALFFGTAEEAAACSDDQGDNYDPYYTAGSLGERVERQFSLPIPALNYEITLATFSGGSQGTKKGLWYTRTIVCNSSAEIDAAISGGDSGLPDDGGEEAGPDESGEQDDSGSADDPGEQEDPGSTDDPGDQGDSGATDDPDDDGNDDDKSSSGSKSGSKNNKSNNSSSSGNTSSTPGAAAPSGYDDDSGQNSQDEATTTSGKKKKGKSSSKAAIPINFVNTDLELDFETKSTAEVDQAEVESAANRKAAMVGGIALFDLVLAGVFFVGLRHVRPRRFPRV